MWSGKKTLRLEGLRDSMGQGAFSEMVEHQQWQRRNRGAAPSEWRQTRLWWSSEEGSKYWGGPPPPDPSLTRDVLHTRRAALRSIWGSNSTREVVVEAPAVALLAARATEWLEDRQLPGVACRCNVAGAVQFNREEGERVPSVHIASKGHTAGRELVMLDAASLDNLKPGDVVAPRRLVQVNGKVLATVGWEARHERYRNLGNSH